LLERSYSPDTLFREGLQIRTTLDLKVQQIAEQAAREQIAELKQRNANNAAVVAIRPASGEILAMVGSVDYNDVSIAGQVNVALADRQRARYGTLFPPWWQPTRVRTVPEIQDAVRRFWQSGGFEAGPDASPLDLSCLGG